VLRLVSIQDSDLTGSSFHGFDIAQLSILPILSLTLRLLMSYIYGAPSKARNANVVYRVSQEECEILRESVP